MRVKALMPVRTMNLVVPLAHKATAFTTHCAFGYNPRVNSKKGLTGCESPKARGAKPHPARFAAFSILTTSYGGPNGRAQALPVTLRVPRSLTPVRAAAQCESWSAVVHLAQLGINMKSQNTNTLHLALTDIDSIAQGGCNSISSIARMALSWLEQPDSLKHTEVLADAFKVIRNIAGDTCNCINSEAEAVGCNWTDPEIEKRYKAVHESKVQS